MTTTTVEIRHFHLFCGLGGGARGFNRGDARVGRMTARFRCIGGVDVDPAAVADFTRSVGVPATHLDLFDREQYRAFHGKDPGPGWREATPRDIRNAAGGERPHIVFLSAPCKGFSGLLSEQRSRSEKYQALNRLTVRGVWLMLEAFADDPPEFVLFENVPRIATRGRHLLDQIADLLRSYGYAVAETTHDCGELGRLAQSRRRFLLVARHKEKVPPFLYEPIKRPLRAVGEVLERFPLPGDATAGPMHRVPSLQWRTWVRLAFVEAGSDWRSLERLRVENGFLKDFAIAPERVFHRGVLGVIPWNEPVGTITSRGLPNNGNFAVADPRFEGAEYSQYGVIAWNQPSGTVTGQRSPGQGRFSVADPRTAYGSGSHRNKMAVSRWNDPARTVTGANHVQGGALSVADPRCKAYGGAWGIYAWNDTAGTIAGETWPSNGRFAVADPRPGLSRAKGDDYASAGHYGVVPWNASTHAVTGSASHDNGPWSVADPRSGRSDDTASLPSSDDRLVAVIRALDNTWHRPFTTLELAALQGLVDPEEHLELEGLSDSAWRERIGNAVPPPAAEAIAGVMGRTLLLAWSGETFALDSAPIWVRPVAVGISFHDTPRPSGA